MDIRNILNKKKENKKRSIMIISITIIILLMTIFPIINISKNNNTIKYKVWDQISINWYITQEDNYPTNTHIISNETTTFWLKTSSINLNNLLNKDITIEGTIDNIDNKYPILTIKNIKDKKSKLIIHDNKYFFTNDLISFDFSQDPDITADEKNNHIKIYYQW